MAKKTMEVMKDVDVKKYMGRWYEIASFPSLFQPKNGANTRATYSLKDDGATINVLNETFTDGKKSFIEGIAYKADPKSDEAKLKVKFYVPPFLPLFPVVGDYWILYLDDDYQYALIGQPSRKYLWILCRENHMDEDTFNFLVQKAVEEGYDVSKLKKTTHSDTPPEGDEIPKDTKGVWWIKSLIGK
ncbi:temperature-induced lipocalin-1-like [Impatiens glandulifera]|uniref:temperature-induced lipocalin-1-like n=1 Tax=Impatiens glandulifera TaxID=253017 RepID=UPI001FB0AB00|nr:temperature-induced lipocalin-1-like [Impatiens glandulifera]